MTNLNIEDVDYEMVPENEWPKKWLGSFINAHIKGVKENLRGKTLNKEVKNKSKSLENDIINIVLDITSSISLEEHDVRRIEEEERFQNLPGEMKWKLGKTLEKRVSKNTAQKTKEDKERDDIRKTRDNIETRRINADALRAVRREMLDNINASLEEAEVELVHGRYEDAILRAKETKEQIEYNREWLLHIQSVLNSWIFKIKKIAEIFEKEESNMTTWCLPEWVDSILRQKEKIANAIIGEAQAAMKKQTKEKKHELAHPREISQELTGNWTPQYQGSLIVSFKDGNKTLIVKNRISREIQGRRQQILLVQDPKNTRLWGMVNERGEAIVDHWFRADFRIVGNNIFYRTVEGEQETERNFTA